MYDDYYEPPDPLVDEHTQLRCINPKCFMFEEFEDPESRACGGGTWHPEIEYEYQGEIPHGGMVSFYVEDSHDCPECGQPGEEVKGD